MSKKDRRRAQVDDEVSKTLASFESLEEIDVGPYFFSRLQANLSSTVDTPEPLVLRFLHAGRLFPALLVVMVVLNVVTAVVILRNGRSNSAVSGSSDMDLLAEQYMPMGTSEGLDIAAE
ncbi:hypothetical protein C3F09_04520 [candidate division GN15 bacterium]|uniref:Uncharacterized protein n=1 Tax=candidate division GN15 bacterium TaxID=2072418 RepID=A0A855X7V8_9BACT|nr:MAG: hypothetical protein C3F09_04520 [candidate division GN15 bacterium]